MKTITLEPTEFYQFRKLAIALSLVFTCAIIKGLYNVQADIKALEEIGY